MPGLYLYGLCDLEKRFLNAFGRNVLPMLSYSISVSLHPLWVYILLVKYDLQLEGIGYAGIITNFLTYICINVLMRCQNNLRPAIFWPDKRVFIGLWYYIKISIPSLFINICEESADELMIGSSGLLTIMNQASMVILVNLNALYYMIAFGL